MFRLFGLLATLSATIGLAAAGPDYSLHVTYELGTAACRWKPMGLVNGSSPGPVITMYENVTTWVRVYNDIPDQNVTMHLHGLGASVPFSDGTPMISQWPIAPGQFFDHQIQPNKAGTYFYQSQIGFQSVSVSGPIIVLEAGSDLAPPYEYDAEKLIIMQDFFNQTDDIIVAGLQSTPPIYPGETEAILINGHSYPALDGPSSGAPEPYYTEYNDKEATCGPAVIEVYPDYTYRFRTIGATAQSLVAYMIEDHSNFTVIGADGEYTYPIYTDMIVAGPGQRFDFLLETKSAEEISQSNKTDYWIQFETRLRPSVVTSYAILRYTTTPNNATYNSTTTPPNSVNGKRAVPFGKRTEPWGKRELPLVKRSCDNTTGHGPEPIHNTTDTTSFPPTPPAMAPLTIPTDGIQDWLEYQCFPLFLNPQIFPPPENVTRRVYLENVQTEDGQYWTVNNVTWFPEDRTTPYLTDIYKYGEAAMPDYNAGVQNASTYDSAYNVYAGLKQEVIEMVLLNIPNGKPDGYHYRPWHFHSAHTWDLGAGPGDYDPDANNQKIADIFGVDGPSKRDTLMLWSYPEGEDECEAGTVQGWRALRMVVISTGAWLMNSQMIADQIMGQNIIWIMGNSTQITTTVPQPYVDGYLDFGGSAYANATVDPLNSEFPADDGCV